MPGQLRRDGPVAFKPEESGTPSESVARGIRAISARTGQYPTTWWANLGVPNCRDCNIAVNAGLSEQRGRGLLPGVRLRTARVLPNGGVSSGMDKCSACFIAVAMELPSLSGSCYE
eukprot:5547722-Pyramimonas_sp.AAC.1